MIGSSGFSRQPSLSSGMLVRSLSWYVHNISLIVGRFLFSSCQLLKLLPVPKALFAILAMLLYLCFARLAISWSASSHLATSAGAFVSSELFVISTCSDWVSSSSCFCSLSSSSSWLCSLSASPKKRSSSSASLVRGSVGS